MFLSSLPIYTIIISTCTYRILINLLITELHQFCVYEILSLLLTLIQLVVVLYSLSISLIVHLIVLYYNDNYLNSHPSHSKVINLNLNLNVLCVFRIMRPLCILYTTSTLCSSFNLSRLIYAFICVVLSPNPYIAHCFTSLVFYALNHATTTLSTL